MALLLYLKSFSASLLPTDMALHLYLKSFSASLLPNVQFISNLYSSSKPFPSNHNLFI